MKIAIGSDHGGYKLKKTIIEHFEEKDLNYEDLGCYSVDSVDYPDIAFTLAKRVAKGEFDRGIIICGTGIGVSIVANKVYGIRAALCNDYFSAKASREHNDANILTLGERVIGPGLAKEIVDIWLETKFQGGRHETRVNKIKTIEKDGALN
ncbi:MAG TPA: ribose 5-phosphate isomerase B [Thermoanaerobacterales bacterium]|nr:ribose 5-phosphate isomerase B [Thermoanaerobacterales bacterium]